VPFLRTDSALLAQGGERRCFDGRMHARWRTIMARISAFTRGPAVRVCGTRAQGARRSASIASVTKRSACRQHDLPTPRVGNFGWARRPRDAERENHGKTRCAVPKRTSPAERRRCTRTRLSESGPLRERRP
jgi:hypothetical protein